MKRCPICQTTYDDDALNFCLQDGATLVMVGESSSSSRGGDATLILPEDAANYLAQLPTEALDPRGAQTEHLPQTAPTVPVQPPRETARDAHFASATPTPQKSSNTLLIIGVTAIVILLLALVGIGAALLFRGTGTQPAEDARSRTNTNQSGDNNNAAAERGNSNSVNRANANDSSVNKSSADAPLHITATASSTRVPLKAFTYDAAHVLDGDLQTAWIEGVPGPGLGEWIRCDFDREVKLNRVRLTPGYFKNASIWKQNNRLAAATLYFSDGTSRRFTFPDEMQWQPLDTSGIRTRFVRLVISDMYPGSVDSEDTAISEISFDWES
ncbi:MAG TPA: discoidin domain-containing protein [Pyrinomonadaceae bacterium]|jgi:hypothetical protein